MTYEEALTAIPKGRYRHYKGSEYECLCIHEMFTNKKLCFF